MDGVVKAISVTIPTPIQLRAMVTCPNCESAVPSIRFCGACGRHQVVMPLHLREIAATKWSNRLPLKEPTLVTGRGPPTQPEWARCGS